MLSSINPLGERARGQRFWLTATWYVVGSLGGGLLMGAISGIVGSMIPGETWRPVAAMAVLAAGIAGELTDRVPPSLHRQVDENWLGRFRGWVYGVGFGAQLGFGVATIVTSASVHTTIAVAVLSGSVVVGTIVGGVFGLVRSLPIVMVSRAHDPSTLRRVMRRLQDRLPTASRLVVAAQVLLLVTVVSVL
ncbi:MAG: hypothetical protein L0Z49_03650 [Actinobacteria bacterium]|nr:hypothetical protein [Actinomycetota bacterium]